MQFNVTYDKGVPEFFTEIQQKPGIERLYGAEMDGKYGIFRYPGFWPFHFSFFADLDFLFPEQYTLTPLAAAEKERQSKLLQAFVAGEFPVDLPDDFFQYEPYLHQRQAIALATNAPRCGWLYDRGLGKTKTAIDVIRINKLMNPCFRTLIIAPAVTMANWAEEVDLHSFGAIQPHFFLGAKKEAALHGDTTVVLTTYETMRDHWKTLNKYGFHRIFFDESHRLRNPKSEAAKAALELVQRIPHRVIMTGSSHWDPRHLYAQLRVLTPALVPEGTYSKFSQKFLRYSKHNRYVVEGFKNMDVLKKRVSSCCLYRTKEECLDLPDRITTQVYVDLSPEEATGYNQIVAEQCMSVGEHTVEVSAETVVAQITALLQASRGWLNESNKDPEICDGCEHLQACIKNKIKPYTKECEVVTKAPPPTTHHFASGAVIERAVSMASEILDEDPTNKIIMWFRSNVTLYKTLERFRALRSSGEEPLEEDSFDSTGIASVYTEDTLERDESVVLVGSSKYGEVVKQFETDPEKRVLFGQIKCGIGINLTAANYTFYPELTMNPEDDEQSVDRNYRPGQKRKTVVFRFIARGTLDAGIAALLQQKTNIQEAIADPKFCQRCEDAGKCILNLSDKPGKSECGLQGFVRRTSLKVKAVAAPDSTHLNAVMPQQNPFDFMEDD